MVGQGMENSAYSMKNAVALFECIDDAVAKVFQLPNGNRLADQLGWIKEAIAQLPNENQLAEKFELIKDAIGQSVDELFNGNQLAEAEDEEKFKSNCNVIISMLCPREEVDMGITNHAAVFGIGADDPLSSLPTSARHARHSHELQRKTLETHYTCDGCKMKGCGSRYSCKRCNFNLHPECMLSSPTSPATCHEFVGKPTFKFLYQRPKVCGNAKCSDCHRSCEACAKPTKGYVYYEEGKERDRGIIFHPCCFKLPRKLSAEGMEYDLCKELSSKCRLCKRKQLDGAATGNTGWAYVSKGSKKEYNVHVFCMVQMLVEKDQKDGDFGSLVLRNNTNTAIKKSGKKFWKIMTPLFRVVLGVLLGEPLNTTVGIIGIILELASS